jgi:uridine monophosphate synthetase
LAAIPDNIPVILDAKRGDIGNTAVAYARACFDELKVDAVTLTPYLGRDSIDSFAQYDGKGLFVLCHTSNPSAADFQHLEISDWRTLDREPNQPLYIHVARTAIHWSPNVGLVVGATYPETLAAVRQAAPQAWFLVPGIGAQGGDLKATLVAGLRQDGLGLIINASRAICLAENHRAAAEQMRHEIEIERLEIKGLEPISQSPNLLTSNLLSGLLELEAVKFGSFTLASGIQSPIYIDLRLLVSKPSLLAEAAEAYAAILDALPCERIAGVPYAALPIAAALAMQTGKPLIYLRKEAKAHGLGREIEGMWRPGERVVIIEDLITSGGSTLQSAERLRAAGLTVEHAIVLIDRQQGGVENLARAGISAHSVLKLRELLEILVAAGKLTEEKRVEVLRFMG